MRCHNICCSFLAALVLLCLRPEVQAESISIVASDNAWVFKKDATTDQIEAELFKVGRNGTTWWHNLTYLRFDVARLAGATITSASLDLYCLNAENDSTVYVCALNDLATAGQTTESTWDGHLTWDTRPDGTGNLPNATYTSGKLASVPVVAGAPAKLVSFDLTSALPWLLESDTNHQLTLILYGHDTGANQAYFASLANTGGYAVPTLNVGYEPIHEPGTLALLGMALVGLGWYAWRKRRRGVTG